MRSAPSAFLVRVPEIPPEGIVRSLELDTSFLQNALEGTEARPDESTVNVELSLHRSAHEVVELGRLDGELTVVCSRCAGPARVSVGEPIDLVFVPRGQETEAPDPDEALNTIEEPDLVPYDGDEIDLAETLREELLLALPLAPLCKETCRGLCPRCGTDLNEASCDCPEDPKDDRWAALRNLKARD